MLMFKALNNLDIFAAAGKLGHCPSEDFSDAFSPLLVDFFAGEDISVKGTKKFRKFETEELGAVAAGIQAGNMVDS